MSSSSLVFSHLTLPKTLINSQSKTHFLNLQSLSFTSLQKPSLQFSKCCKNLCSSRFVRNVAISAELGEDEEESDVPSERNFSQELKLFVGNLPFDVDSTSLAELFEQAGNVEMVEVIYDKITGRSRGFGFVTMSTMEEVEAASQQFNGYELKGRPLRVNFGPPPPKDDSFSRAPRGESSYGARGGSSYGARTGSTYGGRSGSSFDSNNRVYVGNLSWDVDDSALETLFSQKGKVMEAKVVYDRESGRSRGFGFVTYGSAEEVNSAVDSLDGADLDGRSIRVTVAESKPRRQF